DTRLVSDWSSDVCSSDLGRIGLIGDRLAHDVDEVGHLVAKEADEDVVLRLEVEIDRSCGDARFPCNVGHAGVVVAAAGEHPDGGGRKSARLNSPHRPNSY